MIIVRHRKAKKLASTFVTKSDPYYFTNLLLKCKSCTIIYFQDGIKSEVYGKGGFPPIKRVGEMERENLPFILLIDRKCQIFNRLGGFTSIVNANCLSYDALDSEMPHGYEEENKSKTYDKIFSEFVKCDPGANLRNNFTYFVGSAGRSGLLSKDLVFIVMSDTNGEIYNANGALGNSYDEGRIWSYSEEYDYNPKIVDSIPEVKASEVMNVDKINEFSALFDGRSHISWSVLSKYNKAELTEIIRKYPIVFADFVKNGYSYCPKQPAVLDKNGEDFFENDNDKETWADIIDDYNADNMQAPKGMVCCYICTCYVNKEDTELVTVSGEPKGSVRMCDACLGGVYE